MQVKYKLQIKIRQHRLFKLRPYRTLYRVCWNINSRHSIL